MKWTEYPFVLLHLLQEVQAIRHFETLQPMTSQLQLRQLLLFSLPQLLRTQASEIKRLQTERQALLDEVSEWRANGRMVEIAQSFSGDNLGRDMALSYLEDIIEEVKQCLRQLEQE